MMMDEYIDANRRHWDDLTDLHVEPGAYDLESFLQAWRQGKVAPPPGADEFGDVAGLDVLHLQCHFGLNTLQLAHMGARVTGVDLSERSIEVARSTAQRLDVDAVFHCSNVLTLDMGRQFDLVYTSLGVLIWLPDLRPWARVIADHLKPNGTFYMVEFHPFAYVFDDENPTELKVRYPYFHSETPMRFDAQGSYAAPDARIDHPVTFEWAHSVSDILTALLEAGLVIESFVESEVCGYKMLPFMVESDNGWVLPHGMKNALPFTFSIKARKPKDAE